ncbi:MAG: hypothetical protein E7627_01120 [Ruminococcaceae bacterium]|nr:hypothetical protein [Oscillospiraceae bacterium]
MYQFIYVITTALSIFLDIVLTCMFISAVLSWIIPDDEYPIVNLLNGFVELFVAPVRHVLERLGWFQGIPLDISFLITYILLSLISAFLVL